MEEAVCVPPASDIGRTTVEAASLVLRDHKNPYSSQTINVREELEPRFRGFHYGPLMLLAYSPGVLLP